MNPLDRCVCMGRVVPTEVCAESRHEGGVMVVWQHSCGFRGQRLMSWPEYRRFAALRRSALHGPFDRNLALGQFAADLEALMGPDEVIRMWEEQEECQPSSVPRE